MGEEDDPVWEIRNHLLCYLQVQKDRVPRDDLVKVLHDHYSQDDIKRAFKILYENIKVKGDGRQPRPKSRNSKKLMLEDMYDLLLQLENEEVACFTCRDFFALPKQDLKNIDVSTLTLNNDQMKANIASLQEENGEIINELKALRLQVAEMCNIIVQLQQARTDLELPKPTKDPNRESQYSEIVKCKTPNQNNISGGIRNLRNGISTSQDLPSRQNKDNENSYRDPGRGVTKCNNQEEKNNEQEVPQKNDNEDYNDEIKKDSGDGFQFPRKRKKRTAPLLGTGRIHGLKTALTRQLTSVFVGFLDSGTSAQDIEEHVNSLTGCKPYHVEKLTTRNERLKLGLPEYSSFKITVMKSLKDKLLDSEAWPMDAAYREWREQSPINNRATNSNDSRPQQHTSHHE